MLDIVLLLSIPQALQQTAAYNKNSWHCHVNVPSTINPESIATRNFHAKHSSRNDCKNDGSKILPLLGFCSEKLLDNGFKLNVPQKQKQPQDNLAGICFLLMLVQMVPLCPSTCPLLPLCHPPKKLALQKCELLFRLLVRCYVQIMRQP